MSGRIELLRLLSDGALHSGEELAAVTPAATVMTFAARPQRVGVAGCCGYGMKAGGAPLHTTAGALVGAVPARISASAAPGGARRLSP